MAATQVVKTAGGTAIAVNGIIVDPTGASDGDVLGFSGGKFVPTPSGGAPVNVSEFLVTGTSLTTVLTTTPGAAGRYLVPIYYRVLTDSTYVKVTLIWTDAGGAQSLDVVPETFTPVGSYTLSPIYLQVVGSQPISVKFTASVGNRIRATASIVGI